MKCQSCDKLLKGTERFCPACGSKVEHQDSLKKEDGNREEALGSHLPQTENDDHEWQNNLHLYQNNNMINNQHSELHLDQENIIDSEEANVSSDRADEEKVNQNITETSDRQAHAKSEWAGESIQNAEQEKNRNHPNNWPSSISAQKSHSPHVPAAASKKNDTKKGLLLALLIPAASLLIVGGGTIAYGANQGAVNDQIISLHKKAEEQAKAGNYTEAHKKIQEALSLRPGHELLQKEENKLKKAATIQNSLKSVSSNLEKQKIAEAADALNDVRGNMDSEEGTFLDPLKKELDKQEGIVKTEQARTKASKITDVKKLGEMLKELDSFPSEKTGEARNAILSRIVQVTTDKANTLMKQGRFEQATDTIYEGLRYDEKNKKLLKSIKTIFEAEEKYEGSIQLDLKPGMSKLTGKDLLNKNSPLTMSSLKVESNEFGDVSFTGTVLNKSKTAIGLVTIYFKIYDPKGKFLKNQIAYVDQIQIKPGAKGSFKAKAFGLGTKGMFVVDQISWYKK